MKQTRPVDPSALFEQANLHFQKGEYDAAVSGFDECIRSADARDFTVQFSVYSLRGLALYKIGRHEDALRDSTRAINMAQSDSADPEDMARLYYQRGVIHGELGNELESAADFQRARAFDPDGP